MKYFRNLIAFGYVLIVLLIGCIAYTWHREWQEVEQLEEDNRQINGFRAEINEGHIHLIEFSLSGETILDWYDEDLDHYHLQRMAIDSMLCNFKKNYPADAFVFSLVVLPPPPVDTV